MPTNINLKNVQMRKVGAEQRKYWEEKKNKNEGNNSCLMDFIFSYLFKSNLWFMEPFG